VSVTDGLEAVRGGGKDHNIAYRVQSTQDLGDPTPLYSSAVRSAFDDVIRAASTKTRPRVSVADGFDSLRLAIAARDSARDGVPVLIG